MVKPSPLSRQQRPPRMRSTKHHHQTHARLPSAIHLLQQQHNTLARAGQQKDTHQTVTRTTHQTAHTHPRQRQTPGRGRGPSDNRGRARTAHSNYNYLCLALSGRKSSASLLNCPWPTSTCRERAINLVKGTADDRKPYRK